MTKKDVKNNSNPWKNTDGTRIEFTYFDESIINNNYVKDLRKTLGFTQQVFANALGVSKKAVEKWEQGKNPVIGPTARLLHLVSEKPMLINEIYKVKIIEDESDKKSQAFESELIKLYGISENVSDDVINNNLYTIELKNLKKEINAIVTNSLFNITFEVAKNSEINREKVVSTNFNSINEQNIYNYMDQSVKNLCKKGGNICLTTNASQAS